MTPNPPVTPPDEMFARAWHAFSDEATDAIAFGGPGCSCRNYAHQARDVFILFTGEPTPEPDGLGAVVVNPLSQKVYVRDAHPRLPWHTPDDDSVLQWSDPTCEDWFEWKDLPRPLVIQSPGWVPPVAAQPEPLIPPEPAGIGAVVTDRDGRTWVRVDAGGDPWLNPGSLASGEGIEVTWGNLVHPVVIRSHGWQQS